MSTVTGIMRLGAAILVTGIVESLLHFQVFLACQKCQRSQGSGAAGFPSSQLSSLLHFHILFACQTVSTVTRIRRVGVAAILVTIIALELSHVVCVSKLTVAEMSVPASKIEEPKTGPNAVIYNICSLSRASNAVVYVCKLLRRANIADFAMYLQYA